MRQFIAITPFLPVKHDLIVARWGGGGWGQARGGERGGEMLPTLAVG